MYSRGDCTKRRRHNNSHFGSNSAQLNNRKIKRESERQREIAVWEGVCAIIVSMCLGSNSSRPQNNARLIQRSQPGRILGKGET